MKQDEAELRRELAREADEIGDLETCAHGKFLACDGCLDAQYRSGINGGMEVAIRTIKESLGKSAGDLFIKGKDDEAKALRNILAELEKALKTQQSAQLKKP